MKSMLHEASSIINAIEKAWTESGKPSEFTIKILEAGEKGFLGFAKRPAIISITFNEVRAPEKNKFKEREFQHRDAQQKRPRPDYAPRQAEKNQQQDRGRMQSADSQEFARRQQQAVNSKIEQLKVEKKVVQNQGPLSPEESQIWIPEWISFVSEGLRDLLKFLPFQTNFTTKIDKKVLSIMFDKPLMENEDENRAVSASISYILMQYLKRKYKKKFRGYQILVTISSSHESSK
ncbi:MAG: Jag N-terminal domain-containing protein [Candidatus Babeliales bacterium]